MRRFLVTALFPLALALGSDRVSEDFKYNYPLSPGGRIAVENFNGAVEITGSDRTDVEITGTKYADSADMLTRIKIDVQASGSAIRVKTVRPEGSNHGNMGAKYVIRVPRRTELEEIASSNGPIRVEDIEGSAKLRTSNGPVRTSRVRGDVDARTSNAPIEADQVAGALDATTSNGPIRAHSGAGQKPVRATTSNGPVDLQLDAAGGDVKATTSNGGITVRMPASTNARVKAVTSGHSRVSSDFDVTTRGEVGRGRLEGAIGSGGPMLELTTSNGGIRLVKQ